MSNDGRCFECYGYDILLDENLKPWLIEVNASPSITADTETDYHLKFGMLEDLFGVLRVEKTSVLPSLRSWPVTALLDARVPCSTMRCHPPPVQGSWKNLEKLETPPSPFRTARNSDISHAAPKARRRFRWVVSIWCTRAARSIRRRPTRRLSQSRG